MKNLLTLKFTNNIKNFLLKENEGVMAVIFAVILIPILALSGAAVDYTQASNIRNQMQKALDASAIAAGKAAQHTNSAMELQEIARNIFDDNMLNSGFSGNIELEGEVTALGYRVVVETDMPTSFLKLVGIEELPILVSSEVGIPQLVQPPSPPPPPPPPQANKKLEVVLSYHVTHSIDLDGLKDGSEELIEELFEDASGDDVKIGLVPFYKYVNIGSSYLGSSWLNVSSSAGSRPTGFIPSPGKSDVVADWRGCVGTRDGLYEVNDIGYSINKVRGMVEEFIFCGDPLTPLTSNENSIKSAVNAMRTNGVTDNWANFTHFPVGLMWGWAALSPELPFNEGLPYSDDNIKVMIFVNSRVQDRGHRTGQAGSWIKGGTAESVANAEALRVCTNAKKAGIRIYTIRYNNYSASLGTTMDKCASNGKNYSVSNGPDLKEKLEKIADELKHLIEDNDPPPPPPPPPSEPVYEGELRIIK